MYAVPLVSVGNNRNSAVHRKASKPEPKQRTEPKQSKLQSFNYLPEYQFYKKILYNTNNKTKKKSHKSYNLYFVSTSGFELFSDKISIIKSGAPRHPRLSIFNVSQIIHKSG